MSVKIYSMKRDGNIKLSVNFTLKEMQSHDGADEVKIDSALIDYLQQIRDHFGKSVRIIRIGSNTDNYLHPKNTLCIKYDNNTLVSNA